MSDHPTGLGDARLLAETSRRYGLTPLHPAICEITELKTRVAELEKELGRPFVVERGPWTVSDDGQRLYSDDFTHDVMITINGDFGENQRKPYADLLAAKLNRRDQ